MRYFYIIIYTLTLSLPLWLQAADRFFPYLPDIPVYKELDIVDDKSLVFDFASGRIIEHIAILHENDAVNIMQYYDDILPALGWQKQKNALFTREQEKLFFTFIDDKSGQLIVKISLEPK